MSYESKVAPNFDPIGATKQSLEAYYVGLSSDCLVAPIGLIFGATFDSYDKDFENSATIIIKKVVKKWSKLKSVKRKMIVGIHSTQSKG